MQRRDKTASIKPAGADPSQRGRLIQVRGALLKELRAQPNSIDCLQSLGVVQCELGEYAKALVYLRRCVDIDPAKASAHFNLAKALELAGHWSEALSSFEMARKLAPEAAQVHLGLGNLLQKLDRDGEALESYAQAARFAPDLSGAYLNAGIVLVRRGDNVAAIRAFDRLLALEPDAPDGLFGKALSQQKLCDWKDYERHIGRLLDLVRKGRAPSGFALFLITVCDEGALLRCDAERLALGKPTGTPKKNRARPVGERIRLAYVSADFREHPVSALTVGLFEAHDRERFDVTAISFGHDDGSPMRRRLMGAFDRFEDVRGQSNEAIVDRIRELDADIVVDLMGHTTRSRAAIFPHRPAPIQVNFLGFPGTTGIEAMDYMIVDPFIASDILRRNSSEKLVILPHCNMCSDDKREIAPATPARSEEGLPEGAFVFCCFNQMRKLTPGVFDVWMRILTKVEGSVLWLSSSDAVAVGNLRREAEARGVRGDRLVFARRRPLIQEHLARIRVADLVLDTFPYGAHTTASDALWAGCPVLTKPGNSFASRVCGSLLSTIGLPELIVPSWESYEAIAVRLAQNPAELAALKLRLAANRKTSPLFDTQRFARNLERAFEEMMRRHRMNLPPAEIDVRQLLNA